MFGIIKHPMLTPLVPIAKKSADNTSQVLDFVGVFSSAYMFYLVTWNGMQAGTAGTSIWARVGSGGVFVSAGSLYASLNGSGDATAQNQWHLTHQTAGIRATAEDSGVSGWMLLLNPAANIGQFHSNFGMSRHFDNAGVEQVLNGSWLYKSSASFTDLRFMESSAINLVAGTAAVYGLRSP